MSIVGHHPETGVRVEVQRDRAGGPPWLYVGVAVTPSARFRLSATIAQDGVVAVSVDEGAPPGLGEKARLLLRAAWKHAEADEAPPPWRIVRWRADR
jgi:hypothetical protein